MTDWKAIAKQYKEQHEKDTNLIASQTCELIKLKQMRKDLLETIHSGFAPSLALLYPSDNLVDVYYLRLVTIIEENGLRST